MVLSSPFPLKLSRKVDCYYDNSASRRRIVVLKAIAKLGPN